MPISAVPASFMIVRTSAKSRLIRPGIVIRSQMPWTPWRRTSSAMRNASSIDVARSSTSSSRSFGIDDDRVAVRAQLVDAVVGLARRLVPSNLNGVVTMPDRQRAELARDPRDDRRGAGAGASALARGDEDHVRAAKRALDLVVRLLRRAAAEVGIGAGAEALASARGRCGSSTGASLIWSCWMSVLTAMNSTCEMPASIIRFDGVQARAADADDPDHRDVGAEARGTRCSRGGAPAAARASGAGARARARTRSGKRTGSDRRRRRVGAASPPIPATCSTVCSGGSAGVGGGAALASRPVPRRSGCSSDAGSPAGLPSFSACRCAASVARNSSASGPSRMLARFRGIEHLLCEVTVRLGGARRLGRT